MHYFEKKIQIFLSRGTPQKCLGPRENVSPGPAVALDGPAGFDTAHLLLYCTVHIVKFIAFQ